MITKKNICALLILSLRWYVAIYMIDYGYSKIIGEQFVSINQNFLQRPVAEVDKFYLTWYLFGSNKVFNVIIGATQIFGGILLLINSTSVIGALFLLPVIGHIFLIDIFFTTNHFGVNLPIRILCMLSSLLIVLYHNKMLIIKVFNTFIYETIKPNVKWWVYLLMFPVGFFMDFVWAIVTLPIRWLLNLFL